ncbi:hypothetical protein FGO68_gene11794 [Halteria grandinella]|uniref:Uncharacterized protein n=1 Tax=Halteria grandinella TaxID=5974 RepID=A0A8J8T0Y4_HALGN|nr:hypothetical protein FGO68_gene11794 [Halteria grandinella]
MQLLVEEQDQVFEQQLTNGPQDKKDDLDISINERHVEKVHYQIEVDDASFLDKLSLQALINGGSIHQDGQGKKYLFYPIQREGEQEMCLLHEKDCNFKDKISYIHGESELQVRGKIFYQKNRYSKSNIDLQVSREFRNFIIVDNCLIDNVLINFDVTQQYQIISKKFNAPIYLINSVTSMESVDKAFLEIVNILQPPRINSSFCGNLLFLIFFNLMIIGMIAIAQIIFWYLMDANDWKFNVYYQVLIILGCIIAAFIGLIIAVFGVMSIGRNSNILSGMAFVCLVILLGPIMIGLYIKKLVIIIQSYPQEYQRYTWYTISFVLDIPIFIGLQLYWTSYNGRIGAKARIDLFKKFRLRK